jgi:hypothetical protein
MIKSFDHCHLHHVNQEVEALPLIQGVHFAFDAARRRTWQMLCFRYTIAMVATAGGFNGRLGLGSKRSQEFS